MAGAAGVRLSVIIAFLLAILHQVPTVHFAAGVFDRLAPDLLAKAAMQDARRGRPTVGRVQSSR